MKSLIVLISLSVVSFIAQGQEHQLVCKKVVGCPIVNGTCPTCEPIMNTPGRIPNKAIEDWGKRMKRKMGCRFRCTECGEFFREDGRDCIVAWNEDWGGGEESVFNTNLPMVLLHLGKCDDKEKYPLFQNYSHLERKVRTKWTGLTKKE